MANQDRRFSARRVNLYDRDLSINERFLYVLLDDMCGPKGSCFPRYDTMASICGASRRTVAYSLSKLKEAAYLTSRKRQHTSAEFTLLWAIPGVQSDALMESERRLDLHFSDVGFCTSDNAPPYCVNQVSLTSRTTVELSDSETVRSVQGWLLAYPEARRAIGKDPDEEIARACLRAVGGDAEVLARSLEWLHKVKRARPGRSWGWFPVVLGEMSRRTA